MIVEILLSQIYTKKTMRTVLTTMIILVASVVLGTGVVIYGTSLFGDEKEKPNEINQNIIIDAVFGSYGTPKEFTYEGVIMSVKHNGNYTGFTTLDSFVTTANGNIFFDPDNKIHVGKTIRMTYLEAGAVCTATVTFPNGTRIINVINLDFLNNNSSYNKTINSDPRCVGNNIIRQVTDWAITS